MIRGSFQAFLLLLQPLGCISFTFLHHCLLCFDIVCSMSWFYSLCRDYFCVLGGGYDRYVCCYFFCVVFFVLFVVLCVPVSCVCHSFYDTTVVFAIVYTIPWADVRSIRPCCFFFFCSPPGFGGIIFSLGVPPAPYV